MSVVYVAIEITLDETKAAVAVNPWSSEWSGRVPTGDAISVSEETHRVLGEAITFAKMINAD